MTGLPVAASTFPFMYSDGGLDALKHLAGLGYSRFEMMIFPPHCWPSQMPKAERDGYRSWLDGTGGRITSFCYPLLDNNPNSVCRIMRRYTLDRYKEAIALAADWKCPYVCAIPGPVNSLIDPPVQWMREWFVEGMKELVDFARGSGVEIILENVTFTYLPAAKVMLDVANDIGPQVGINFDICNSAFIKEDVGAAIRMLGKRIKNVHISDSTFAVFKHDRLGIASGIVEPGPAAQALREIGYDGITVLEIIADAMNPANTPDKDIPASHDILAAHGWEKRRTA
ncbi:MAG: sugar phosphate isomerase/epimerase family protein [Acetobacteraceae bacterium]